MSASSDHPAVSGSQLPGTGDPPVLELDHPVPLEAALGRGPGAEHSGPPVDCGMPVAFMDVPAEDGSRAPPRESHQLLAIQQGAPEAVGPCAPDPGWMVDDHAHR